jgi:hypothetical protein
MTFDPHVRYELRGIVFNGEASKRWVGFCPLLQAQVSIKVVDLEHHSSELEALQVQHGQPVKRAVCSFLLDITIFRGKMLDFF